MSGGWSSQNGDDLDDIDAWMARRNAQAALQPQADAFARKLWSQASQNGGDLYAGNPSDLTAIGLAALGGVGPYATTAANSDDQGGDDGAFDPYSATGAGLKQDGAAASDGDAGNDGPYPSNAVSNISQQGLPISGSQSPGPDRSLPSGINDPWVSELDVVGQPTTPTPHDGFLDRLNHSLPARVAGGAMGYIVGLPWSAIRAGRHAVEGVEDGVNFARSLLSPEGRAEALNEAMSATHNALQYGRSVMADPSELTHDAISGLAAANRSLNPLATPIPDTASGAFGHELDIGANAGETLTNIVGAVALPEVAEGLNAVRTFAATRDANIAKFMGQGFDEATARYLSKPYKGQGEHAIIPQAQDRILGFKPPWLGKVTIPDWIMDSPLNVSKPRGLSQGDFYEYHYGVDPHFYGSRLPRYLNGGKGWSGGQLGAERYSGAEQLWRRTPQIWKDYPAGATLGDSLGLLPGDDPGAPQ
jgi:hypothetical protein